MEGSVTILPPYARAADALDAYAHTRGNANAADRDTIRRDIVEAFEALAATIPIGDEDHAMALSMAKLYWGRAFVDADPATIALAAQRWRDRGAQK